MPHLDPGQIREGLLGKAGLPVETGDPEQITDIADTKFSDTQRIDTKERGSNPDAPRGRGERKVFPPRSFKKETLDKLSLAELDVVDAFMKKIEENRWDTSSYSPEEIVALALSAERKRKRAAENRPEPPLRKTG